MSESLSVDSMRDWVREHVQPLERLLLDGDHAGVEAGVASLRDAVRARGWWAPQLSRELGGMGLSLTEYARVAEALGTSPIAHLVFGAQAPDAGNLEILAEHATAEQRTAWLEPLAAGRIRSCFGMTEPDNPGSNPVMLSTTARLDGDAWVIDGRKWFTTGADGSALCIVMAVTDPDAPPHRRASMILVPTDAPGYRLERNLPVMGERGSGWASHGEVSFSGCRVPQSNLLGRRGAGFAIAQQRLGPGRIHHCMRWIGVAERALEMMCRRALARDIGRGTLADQQTVQTWIADSRTGIDAARLLVLDAAEKVERDGGREARAAISSIKFYVADVMLSTLDRALQVHGGLGVTDDTILAWLYRHERAARIYDGPDEVHRGVVARETLKRYAAPEQA